MSKNGTRALPKAGTVMTKGDVTHCGTFTPLPVWVLRHPRLSSGAKLLYGQLMSFLYGKDGRRSYPGQKRLARDLGCSVRTARRWLGELVGENLVERQPRREKRNANEYQFLAPSEELLSDPRMKNKHLATELATGRGCPEDARSTGHERPQDEATSVPRRRGTKGKKRTSSRRRVDDVPSDTGTARKLGTAVPDMERSRDLIDYLRSVGLYGVYRNERNAAANLTDDQIAIYASEALDKRNPGGFFCHQLRERDHCFKSFVYSPLPGIRARRQEKEMRELLQNMTVRGNRQIDAVFLWPSVVVECSRRLTGRWRNEEKQREVRRDYGRALYYHYCPVGYDGDCLMILHDGRYHVRKVQIHRVLGESLEFLGVHEWRLLTETDMHEFDRQWQVRADKFGLSKVFANLRQTG